MNMLIDLLPQTVDIEGVEYNISTNFRDSILFELLMQDNSLTDEEKLYSGLQFYYRDSIPEDLSEAVKQMLWFYRCGKEENTSESTSSDVNSNQIYSYEYDDDYIYSAFLDQYNIDLQDIDDLHWWKFKAMFKSLKEDNKISKIMGYRSIKISNDMSDSDKKYYKEMKQVYALPDNRSEEEKQLDFDRALSSII